MSDKRSPEEIQRDIEKTRERLAEDLDALSYRVSPEGLRDRAETGLEDLKDVALGATQDALRGVTDRAEAAGASFSARLRAQPLPLSLLGAAFGVGWLLVNAAKQGSRARSAAPVLTPDSHGGTGRIVDASGETIHEPETKPDWLTTTDHGSVSTQTLLVGAAALLGGAAVGALLPGKDAPGPAERAAPRAEPPAPRVPVTPPVDVGPVEVDPGATPVHAESGAASPEDAVFRRHFESDLAASGQDYAYYEPAYRYGEGLPSTPMHRSRSWDEAAADAQRDWERSHHEPWDEVRDAVRRGWEHGLKDRRV